MKIIIYGLGIGRVLVERYLKKEHQIVGYSDSFSNTKTFNDKAFLKPSELSGIDYDFIILTIFDFEVCNKIKIQLANAGINITKIFDFYRPYLNLYTSCITTPLKVDRVMEKYQDKVLEGIILGISHAEIGINTKCLEKEFCNLAVSSQDLYYNLKTLQILVSRHREKLKNLEYVIFDLYKYTYFNYDVSLSNEAMNYYLWSGFRNDEKHHFVGDIDTNIRERLIKEVIPEDIELFFKLFKHDQINIDEDYKSPGIWKCDFLVKENRSKVVTDEDIQKYISSPVHASSIQRKLFEQTEKENIKIFRDIMELLKEINPNIKIYLILIPQFKVVEDRERVLEKEWKKRFYELLDEYRKEYQFEILDFKNYELISSQKDYYNDLGHLNYEGATAFTKVLQAYINK